MLKTAFFRENHWRGKFIKVTNTSNSIELNGHQVRFTFDPSIDPDFFGRCGKNGENLCVWTMDNIPLPTYIESWFPASATIWFKIDSVPIGGYQTYQLHANGNKFSPDDVFELFDDFDDQYFDTKKWYLTWWSSPSHDPMQPDPDSASTWRWDEGISFPSKLTFYNNYHKRVHICSHKTFTGDYTAFVRYTRITDTGNIFGVRIAFPEDELYVPLIGQIWINNYAHHTRIKVAGDDTVYEYPVPSSIDQWIEVSKIGDIFKAKTSWGIDDSKQILESDDTFRFVLIDENWDDYPSHYIAIDLVRITKYIDSEPEVTLLS